MPRGRMKRCGRCKRDLPRRKFPLARARPDGLHSYCRECKREWDREWYAKHRESRREAKRRSAQTVGRANCSLCGHPLGEGSKYMGITSCYPCWSARERERITERAELIAQRWAAGASLKEIAAELGWTVNHLGKQMHTIRQLGLADLPRRYKVVDGKRVAA